VALEHLAVVPDTADDPHYPFITDASRFPESAVHTQQALYRRMHRGGH
jgi:hypothetical protein